MHSIWLFSNKLKIAKVIPINKAGPTNQPGNYRPISLLPSMSKTFDLLILNILVSFFQRNKIFVTFSARSRNFLV